MTANTVFTVLKRFGVEGAECCFRNDISIFSIWVSMSFRYYLANLFSWAWPRISLCKMSLVDARDGESGSGILEENEVKSDSGD